MNPVISSCDYDFALQIQETIFQSWKESNNRVKQDKGGLAPYTKLQNADL